MKADLDSAHGDRVEHPLKDAPRLVTAQDIARARIAAQPPPELPGGVGRMLQWFAEVTRARAEKEKGEWQLP